MKIYRYPESNKNLKELTDQKRAGKDYHINDLNQSIQFNITKDEPSERKSMIDVVINEEDIEYISSHVFALYRKRIRELEEEKERIRRDKDKLRKAWDDLYWILDSLFDYNSVNLADNKGQLILTVLNLSDKTKYELYDDYEFNIKELKTIAEQLKKQSK